jgi:hypothetical protein
MTLYKRLIAASFLKMGEYITPEETIAEDLGHEGIETIARDLGDEDTEKNLAFINELRALEISGLVDLPQVSSVVDD